MDKKVIFAVAGSGKTTHIINQLSLTQRSLVVTYTENNLNNLRSSVLEKFGFFPDNIRLLTYFTFLYSFCYRPFLSLQFPSTGINYESNPNQYAKQSEIKKYFFDTYGRIYGNRIAKLLDVEGVLDDVNARISKYFDSFYIDEIQDLGGHDFNFLKSLAKALVDITFVGDFYQHTFDTSRDGTVNKCLHNDYSAFKSAFEKMGICVDTISLEKSHRCSPTVCTFIQKNLGIEIISSRSEETQVCFIERQEDADAIFHSDSIVKLFYQQHLLYGCYSTNWGASKGENKYHDVCIVLNKSTLETYHKGMLHTLPPATKNKLYVALSRARNNIYLVSYDLYEKYKQKN